MNKEDYVSLEVAKLLKEKGFDNLCEAYYHLYWDKDFTEEECFEIATDKDFKNSNNKYRVGAPTLYEAQKWLRNARRLHIEISYMYGDYWLYDILTIPTHDLIGLSDRDNVKYTSYEEALNAGILETLKLI